MLKSRARCFRTILKASLTLALTVGLCAAQVEILKPEAGAELTGSTHVVVRTASQGVDGIHARIGDRPWVAMYHAEDDTWRARLDTSLAPSGLTTIHVQQWPASEGAAAAVEVTLENQLQHYWGDLHSHTSVSDGRMRPDEAYAYARDIAKLDFFALADHLEKVDPAEWRESVRAATLAHQEGIFVAFPGLEWSKSVGHMCVYDPAGFTWPEDLADFYTFAPANCALAKFNHPGWRDTTFNDFAYSEDGDSAIQLMEVRSDGEMGWFIKALDLGWHLAPDGSDDTHREQWGTSNLWTVALAPGLSRDAIIDALKSRHCYSTRDRNCRLTFTLNQAVMGDIVDEPVASATVTIVVDDPDEGDLTRSIELYGDGKLLRSDQPEATARRWSMTLMPEPGRHYYFVKVTQADGNLLYSAPIWITTPDG